MKNNPLFIKLLSLNLPTNDFALVGTASMYARGLKELSHDLDIVARGEAWKKASELGKIEVTRSGEGHVISLFSGEIEVFDSWALGNPVDINQLIDSADIFEGLRFEKLEDLIEWKKKLARPKDLEHIKIIEDYLATGENKLLGG